MVVRDSYDLEWSGYRCLACEVEILTVYEKDGDGQLFKFTPPREEGFESDVNDDCH